MVAGSVLLASAAASNAQSPSAKSPSQAAEALADAIDRHIAHGWKAAGVTPAAPADDAEFLRRLYLDLAGRIPSVAEARQFLDDRRPDRRRRLVERLLASPRYAAHFTRVWRALWLPEAGDNLTTAILIPSFENWLEKQLTTNRGYDAMVRELLTVSTGEEQRVMLQGQAYSPVAFYMAKDKKPENLAGATARLFLGVSIDCAQCHHHPCGAWKREDFWAFAAFFANIDTDLYLAAVNPLAPRQLTIPGTGKVVEATFLGGGKPKGPAGATPRSVLAAWLTSADNPYFARAAVNRVWAYFFGTGLADPVDDMFDAHNVPSHPELLDELARQFTAHRFDLKFLMRAITTSRTYQLTSAGTHKSQDDPRRFARMHIRGLTPEQLFDSVSQATGYREAGLTGSPFAAFQAEPSLRADFLGRFANPHEKTTEPTTSILQALTLMNGKLIADATSLKGSETLAAIVDAPFLDTAGRIETLYLAALSRRPRPAELARLVRYVDGGGSAGRAGAANCNRALADVFWALLNSGEFLLNH
jgi:hypothetical protein